MTEAFYYHAVAVFFDGDTRKIGKLAKKFGRWEAAYRALSRAMPPRDPAADWRRLEETGARLVLCEDQKYPPLLKEIDQAPLAIYIIGNIPDDRRAPVAIVGTRRASPEGKTIARHFARELAQAGIPIVSGLAFGIDSAAHEGCLDAGGRTIAVLAGGLGDVYPHEHRRLAEKILKGGGAVVSEYPPDSPPYADRFIERNRIISGLSSGVLIVEAPEKSGSLATAGFAAEQNRDLYVVPGPVTHRNFKGSHALIRQGAELVASVEDILAGLGVSAEERIRNASAASSTEERLILEALRDIGEPADVDKVASAARLEPRIVNRLLSFLLLKNLVKEKNGGYTI